jgi:hypothetical protein
VDNLNTEVINKRGDGTGFENVGMLCRIGQIKMGVPLSR